MQYRDLRDFIRGLEQRVELKRIQVPISPVLEMTEVCDRTLRAKGPALLFEKPTGFDIPVLGNLFGTPERVAMGMGAESVDELREIGKLLAFLKEPEPPKGLKDAWSKLPIFKKVVSMAPKVIMRWLSHRGGALDYREWCEKHPGQPFPVAVALGADPATILGAVTPVPDTLSEYAFAGLLRGNRTELVKCRGSNLHIPATAEIILEGVIHPGEMAPEGPYGDHTGYYNEVDSFPVFTVERITHRQKPIYHSTYTGRPPDEPAILGVALNEVFVPILQKQFPEIVDFYLPPEGCSYRMAVVTIKKQYPGHAKRVMLGVWSFLRQFMYTKFVIVTDDDINARDWNDVIWAITTRMDPKRDTVMIDNTPIDYLDFASPVSGLGSKMGLDATHKWPGETTREWGRVIVKDEAVTRRIDELWDQLGID